VQKSMFQVFAFVR